MSSIGLAIVTGATGGVGAAVARRLCIDGFDVLASGRDANALRVLAEECASRSSSIHLDVGSFRSASDARRVADVAHSLALPSVLVNAAGVFGPIGPPSDSSPEDWEETFAVNVTAPMCLSLLVAKDMLRAGRGRIVNVSSAQSLHPPDPIVSAYATSKVALNFATRCLAAELAGSDVAACVIHPGDVMTAMWQDIARRAASAGPPAAGLSQWAERVRTTGGDSPEASARLVTQVISQDAAWSNGRFLAVDGGFDHHPPVDW